MAKSLARPTQVKVGWRTYKILAWAHDEAHSAGYVGQTRHTIGDIRVDFTMAAQTLGATLLHEILHAISCVWTIEDSDKEERRIQLLENGLATVWRDNPEVMAWIGQQLSEG